MALSSTLPEVKKASSASSRHHQRTLRKSISISGIGIFTGEKATLRLCPAEADSGIIFQRLDLASKPFLPASLEYVQETPLCTMIGSKGALVQTVEHLLAALKAYQIDNVLIELKGPEVPILDGSSAGFVEMIETAGIAELEEEKEFLTLDAPVSFSQGNIHLIALPSEEYRISYTLHYPHAPVIGTQFYTFAVSEEGFKKEIASCRTFSLYEDIAPMIKKGLLKGGSLENAILIKEGAVANPEGLRYPDEMVRHKILDLIGDLSLIGIPFLAHIVAIRSGHATNRAFAKELRHHFKENR